MTQILMAGLYLIGAFCCMQAFTILNRAASAMHQVYGVGWVVAAVVCIGTVAVCHAVLATKHAAASKNNDADKKSEDVTAVAKGKAPNHCPHCGAPLGANKGFCDSCKKKTYLCPHCGADYSMYPNATACHACKRFFEDDGCKDAFNAKEQKSE